VKRTVTMVSSMASPSSGADAGADDDDPVRDAADARDRGDRSERGIALALVLDLALQRRPGVRDVDVDSRGRAAVRQGLEAAGVKVTSVAFDAQATDLLGPVTAAGAQSADLIVPIAQGQGCVGIAKALKQLGNTKPVVATPVCLSGDVAQGLGGDLPTWTYGIAQTLPTDQSAADAKAYLEAATASGLDAKDASQVFAALAWSEILTYAKMFNEIGADKVSPETVSAALKKFTGPVIMGAPEVKCGQFADAPAVCNSQSKFYDYQGQGSFKQVANWLRPPA
jgi:branched-chain amino acid transport system substrate-binding protein